MKSNRAVCLAITVVLCAASPLAPTAQSPRQEKSHDMTGRWSLVVTFDAGGGFGGNLDLKQQGEKLEGTLLRGESTVPVKGILSGRALLLLVEARGEETTEYIDAAATIENDDTIKGRLLTRIRGEGTDLGAGGPFVATRKR